jgi:hypothetical protein
MPKEFFARFSLLSFPLWAERFFTGTAWLD